MSLCNESKIQKVGIDSYTAIGAPTEAALRVLVEKVKHYDRSF